MFAQELNVRPYVERGGRPGVWFFDLDAANPVLGPPRGLQATEASPHLHFAECVDVVVWPGERLT